MDLTELEGAVLGAVQLEGPCTAYAVRKVFQRSPSTFWSGSAGAIYPLLERLELQGLLASTVVPRGAARRKTYTLTRAGRTALRRWIGPPLPDRLAALQADPIRTRIGFLASLSPAGRRAFLEAAEAQIAMEIELTREYGDARKETAPFEFAASRGLVAVHRARLRWIRGMLEDPAIVGPARVDSP